jgi:hypothetical protein
MWDLIYDIPPARLAFYCSAFFVGVTWLGIVFVRPFLRLLIGREPGINDLVFHTTAGFSLFYGLLLGLLSVAAYQNLEKGEQAVFREASSLASLYRMVSNYPQPSHDRILALLRDYTLYTIHKDFPAHRRGVIYRGGANRVSVILQELVAFEPATHTEEALQSQTLAEFDDFLDARQARAAMVLTRIPGVLWYVVAIGAAINIILIWMLRMRFFTHMVLGGIVAFFLGVVIFLVATMDSPMRGEISVQSTPYQLLYDGLMQWDEEA